MPTTRRIRHLRRSAHVVALLAAATLALTAACSAEGPSDATQKPATSTPQETETSPVVTPAATPAEIESEDPVAVSPPVLPDAAKENIKEGAAAFVEHYIAVWNYSSQTLQTARLAEVSSTTCSGCADQLSFLEALSAEGSKLEGYRILVTNPPRQVAQHKSAVGFELDFYEPDYEIVRKATSDQIKGAETAGAIVVVFEDQVWNTAQFGARTP